MTKCTKSWRYILLLSKCINFTRMLPKHWSSQALIYSLQNLCTMSLPIEKFFLLDAMALIYRAHFAFSKNPRINSQGINTGATLGFTNALLEVIQKEKPTHIAVAFDKDTPTWRHQIYQEYKAHRLAQPEDITVAIPHVKQVLEAFGKIGRASCRERV